MERKSFVTSCGSVVAAAAASSCCWLPVLLLALGASASAIAATVSTIERLRPVLAIAAISLLGVAAYFTYVRRPAASAVESCCEVRPVPKAQVMSCTCCGEPTKRVPARTVRALVHPRLAHDVVEADYGLCVNPSCAQVYSPPPGGRAFLKTDLAVRVGFKEQAPPHLVCYCFTHSVEDIEAELRGSGTTTIPDRITAEIKAGRCACDVKNPHGTCCLGDVHRAVRDARDRLAGKAAAPVGAPSVQCAPVPALDESHQDCCGLPRGPVSTARTTSGVRRVNQIVLPFMAAAILGMVLFPHQVFGILTARSSEPATPATPATSLNAVVLHVPGMT